MKTLARRVPTQLLTLFCLALLAGCGQAEPTGSTHSVTVASSGTGKVSAEPDMAMIGGDIVVQSDSADKAMNDVRRKLDKLISKVRAQGVEDKYIQAAQVRVSPRWQYNRNEPRSLAGFEGRASFQIRLLELDKLPSLYSVLAQAGVNDLRPATFDFSDRDTLELKAIALAVENARLKATAGLKPLGNSVGGLVSMSIDTNWQRPQVMQVRSAMMASDGAQESQPQVNVGEQTVSSTVQVVFSVK